MTSPAYRPIEGAQRNPYPGPRPFSEEEAENFCGRGCESRDLFSLLRAHRVLLIYSQSGAGKTSLINAGLIPALKLKPEFEILPVARVSAALPEIVKANTVSNVYAFSSLMYWAGSRVPATALSETSIPAFLAGRRREMSRRRASVRVIIFDQFEELFSTYPEHWRERAKFVMQIRDALQDDPMLRIAFAMREEYIAQLDPLEDLLPEGFGFRFRLERLGREAALDAIRKPMEDNGRRFSKGVAEKLVRDLATERVQTAGENGKVQAITGQYVEPVQLQVVCKSLWSRDVKEITRSDLRAFGNVSRVLSEFYDDAIKCAADKGNISERPLRLFCEKKLITSVGTRGTVYEEDWTSGGIPKESVRELLDRYLIRAEWRAGILWYELAHDRFIGPIQESNKAFFWKKNRRLRREITEIKQNSSKAKEIERTIQTAAVLSTNDDPKQIFSAVAEQIRSSLPFDFCTISALSSDVKYSRILFQHPESAKKLEQGRWFPVPTFLRAWITSPEITIEQVGKFFGRPGFTKMLDRPDYREFMKRGFISLIRYPIVRGGRVVAAMSLWSCTRTYSERDKKLFAALPVEQALLTALYYQETSELRFRLDLVRELSICKDNEILADLLVTRLASHYKWENVFIYKVSRAHGVFELQSQQTPTKIPKGYSQPLTEGILGEAYRKNKDINIANVRTDPKYAKQYKAVCRNSLSELCMPIRSDDTVIGLLNIEDPLENAFTTQEEHAIREVLDMVGEVMDRVANSNLITASFEATPTAVFILDERGIIEKVNPSALRLMHYREEKITGTAIRDYLCDPESLQDVLKHRGAAPKPTELKTGTGDRVRVLFKANRGRRSRSVVVSALVLESEISNP